MDEKLGRMFLCCCFVLGFGLSELCPGGPDGDSVPPRRVKGSDHIETKADKLDYDQETGWIEAVGNVHLRKGQDELRAQYVRVNVITEEANAFGNVRLNRAGMIWTGTRLRYNFKTREMEAERSIYDSEPYHVLADKFTRSGALCLLEHAKITTCAHKYPDCHYHIRAREVAVVPGEYLEAKGAVWYFGKMPVMYVPYWYRNLQGDFGFRFYPGYSSRMGAFLLSSYRYRMSPTLKGETHLDYRSRRGIGVGQDVKWNEADQYSGELSLYYIDDKAPIDDDEDPATTDIDNQRYRLKIRHSGDISDRSYLMMQGNYLSDTDILEDFFEDEYRESRQPENYVAYGYRGDRFAGNVVFQSRLNDFYSNVNRLPECSLDFMRSEIGNSSLYYGGQTAVSVLQQVWEKENTVDEDYTVMRIDTEHMLYRPARCFGFLNLIPRAGYRGTYYSKTRLITTAVETTSTTETNIVIDAAGNTNEIVSVRSETESSSIETETGADFRSFGELGMEVSFKAFKTWGGDILPRRHIVEPYANYTFVPEPTLLPENIYQFDDLDGLGEEHSIQMGVRNKIQTKKAGRPFDLLDVDVYTKYRIKRDEDEDAIDRFYFDAEFRPSDWLAVDVDAEYDVGESTMDELNTRLGMIAPDAWSVALEHRFVADESSVLAGDVTLIPNIDWTLGLYGRFELDEGRVEEQWAFVQRNLDCMAVKTGFGVMPGYTRSDGTNKEDEWRVMLEIWFTAFPQLSLAGRHKN
jgi:LPS-assembly protein